MWMSRYALPRIGVTFAILAFLILGVSYPSIAADSARYTSEGFEAAQKAGKPILVEVSAPWCPICKSQKAALAKLGTDVRFKELQIFDVDFDSQKDVLRRFDARMQSTLIVFKGATETGRSVGETQPEWIEGLLEKAL